MYYRGEKMLKPKSIGLYNGLQLDNCAAFSSAYLSVGLGVWLGRYTFSQVLAFEWARVARKIATKCVDLFVYLFIVYKVLS